MSFWVAPERQAEFEVVYEAEIRPWLAEQGIEEYPGRGRPTIEGVFSRLFVFPNPALIDSARHRLLGNRDLPELLRRFGQAFDSQQDGGLLKAAFRAYRTPLPHLRSVVAGEGSSRPLGPGRGRWSTLDVTDGLSGPMVQAILQDRQGHMWFGTRNNGVSRYDGEAVYQVLDRYRGIDRPRGVSQQRPDQG
jgi:hypothetical protein